MAWWRPHRYRLRPWALGLCLCVAGCAARSSEPARRAAAPLDVSPARQVDWLPADASLVLHVDVDELRNTHLYRELAGLLPEHPPVRSLLERTHAVRLAVATRANQERVVALFAGDYDEHVNPTVLAQDDTQVVTIRGQEVHEHVRSHDRWFRTPEGFWLVSEPQLFDSVFASPDTRSEKLGAQPWARAHPRSPLVHAAALMSPLWREQMAQSFSDPVSASMFLPAVDELRVLTFDVTSDASAGFLLEISADFASSKGAQSAAFMLQAALLAVKSRAHDAQASAEADAAAPGTAPSESGAYALGRDLAQAFTGVLDGITLDVQGAHLAASLLIGSDMLDQVRAEMRKAAARAALDEAASGPP